MKKKRKKNVTEKKNIFQKNNLGIFLCKYCILTHDCQKNAKKCRNF